MKILSWNVNGIRAIAKKGMLDWLVKDGADVICLQETKVFDPQELDPSFMSPGGYASSGIPRKKEGYSGVVIYTKQQPRRSNGTRAKEFDTEGRTIVAYFDTFALLNVYFPNGKQNGDRLKHKMDFYDAFLSFCDRLQKKIPLVMCAITTRHTRNWTCEAQGEPGRVRLSTRRTRMD